MEGADLEKKEGAMRRVSTAWPRGFTTSFRYSSQALMSFAVAWLMPSKPKSVPL